jgi:hypothetical protein
VYKELGLELISLGEYHPFYPKWPPMEENKRDNRVGYLIKGFLEESPT